MTENAAIRLLRFLHRFQRDGKIAKSKCHLRWCGVPVWNCRRQQFQLLWFIGGSLCHRHRWMRKREVEREKVSEKKNCIVISAHVIPSAKQRRTTFLTQTHKYENTIRFSILIWNSWLYRRGGDDDDGGAKKWALNKNCLIIPVIIQYPISDTIKEALSKIADCCSRRRRRCQYHRRKLCACVCA